MAIVGIDLGCLNAVVAQAERGGVTVLLNENSKRLNSCMVSFQGKQRFLGEQASSIARSNYKNTVSCMKRLVGRKFNEPEVQAECARCVGPTYVEMPDGTVGVEVNYDGEPKRLGLPSCIAMMLFKLSQITADNTKGQGISDCVVSVPCWFSNQQRLATLDACEIAGLRCLRLMHDTTATALEYGIWRSAKKAFDAETPTRIMFVDVGYSSYQVSVVDYVIGKLAVKATTFDRTLGGRDFDLAIAEWIAAEFKAKHKCDPMSSPKPRMKLLDAAEKAKKTLSPHGVGEASIYLECLMNDLDFNIKLPLEKFEELVAPLLARLTPPVDAALALSGTDGPSGLHSVEICGGGSRVASVKKVLADRLGLDKAAANYGLKTTLNADECTSKGCAMQAAMLSPRFKVKEYSVIEATPFGVALSWEAPAASAPTPMETDEDGGDAEEEAAGSSVVLFPRLSETPATKRLTFRRGEDFKITASYDAASAALLPPGAETGLGEFEVKGVPAGASRVRVNVSHGIHGTVSVASAQLVVEVPDEEPAPAKEEEAKAEGKEDDAKDAPSEEKDAKADAADAKPAEPADEKAEAAPIKKKRKYKKTPLDVTSVVPRMDRAGINAALELEAQMAHADKIIQETNDMRNELEAYIYKMRDEIIGDLRPFVSDEGKAKFESALQGAEEWLYEGDGYDATKRQYSDRLGAVKALGDPVEARRKADVERPPLVAELQAKVEALKTFANSSSDEHAHVDDSERATVRDAATGAADWLMDALEKQGALEKHDDPALTPVALKDKLYDLNATTRPILTKPKPLPKKEEKPEPAPAPPPPGDEAKAAEPPAEGKEDADMPDAPAAEPSGEKADVDMEEAAPEAD